MNPAPHSFFLGPEDGFSSPRFALLHQPPAARAAVGAVLYLHPLGEEMNRSRRMVALQARRLAGAGWVVLQLDLQGCGDSAGHFADASWDGWVQDVAQASAWLQARTGHAPWLWGLRTGALLAASAAQRMAVPPHLLLWQPVLDGSTAQRQWLRIGAHPGSMASQRQQQLQCDEAVHVGGYSLSPLFAKQWAASQLQPPAPALNPPAHPPQLIWLDVSADGAALPAHTGGVQAWRAAHWQVAHSTLVGPAFWTSADIECAPALLAATDAAMAAHASSAPAQDPNQEPVSLADHPDGTEVDGVCERPLPLRCGDDTLLGLLSQPLSAPKSDLGLVIVVGGPQVRCGAHRMFTQLARHVAAQGHTALRFDLRGMGDSDGEPRSFDDRDADIAAAITALRVAAPQVQRVLLWGLCDGASAALLFAGGLQAPPVQGLCLVNPWARNPASLAQTRLAHHYRARLTSPMFWWRALRGRVSPRALGGWLRASWQARRRTALPLAHFTTRMAAALEGLAAPAQPARLQLFTASADETAQEFHTFLRTNAPSAMAQLQQAHLLGADHTFSKPGELEWLCTSTSSWMLTLPAPQAPRTAPHSSP